MRSPLKPETLAELKAAAGDGGWLDSSGDLSAYTVDFRRLYRGATPLVLLPRTVDQVARIMAICHRSEVGVVPHGGNTELLRRRDTRRIELADRPRDEAAQSRAAHRPRQ